MKFYGMEQFELGQQAYEEMLEWFNYEADMATNPYGTEEPIEEA